MELNLADLFEQIADTLGPRIALVHDDRHLSYAELDTRANRLAHHLDDAGVRPGEHVGIQLCNGTIYVEAILACLKIRAVPVNVNYRYVADELIYLYRDADLVALLYDVEFEDRVTVAARDAPALRHLISVGGAPHGLSTGVGYDSVVPGQSGARNFPERSGDDLYIIYTGGTTGKPKGVMWRQEDLFFAGLAGGNPGGAPFTTPADAVAHACGSGPFVLAPAAPLMHGAAQFAAFITFLQGGTVALTRKFDARELLELIQRERVLTINIVGDAMARPLAEELAARDYDTSSLLVLSSTGAILSGTVRRQLQDRLPDTVILDNFGSTETGFTATGIDGATPETGLTYQVNEHTNVLGPDLRPVRPGSGEIGTVARSRHIPVGYYKDPEKTAQVFVETDGERWCLAGDMATVQADNTITVLGRGSVCINTGGEKVYPEEVEATLKAHHGVFDAVVTGIADPRYGQRVAAVLQAYPGAPHPGTDELDRHCRARLAGYKVPRSYVFVPEVFRSPSGKTDYTWAREVAARGVRP